MFGGPRHCRSGDIMVLICHVISQNHVLKRSFDVMGRRRSWEVTIVQSLVGIGTLVEKTFLVCHVISKDHVIKGACAFMDLSPSTSYKVWWP